MKRAWVAFCIWRQGPMPHLLPKRTSDTIPTLPSDHEFRIEKPKKLLRNKVMDSLSFYGGDAKGNWLVARIVRKFHRQSEVWLHLGLADGTVYQLVDHPDTTVPTVHAKDFNAGDLRFTQIEPMRKWRLTFNGTLRRGVAADGWRSRHDDTQMEHVRLNFIWTSCSDPCDVRESWSTNLLSQALAREPWRSGNWFSAVGLEAPGYDQFGVLDGMVRVGDNDPGTRLYLRGNRERRWGEVQEESLARAVHLRGVAENGSCFALRATCRQDGLTHAQWGIVRLPTGLVVPVTNCYLNLAEIAHEKDIPGQLIVRFAAGSDSFTASIQFQENQGATLYSGHPWRLQTFLRKFQFGMNGFQGIGMAEFIYKYRGRCPVPQVPVVGQLVASPWETKDHGIHPLVCRLQDHAAHAEQLAGGKGASLALLSTVQDKGFVVPTGFCVTTAAYAKQLASSTLLQAAIVNIKEISTGQKDGDFKIACEKTVKAFEETEMLKEIKAAIDVFLKDFKQNGQPLDPCMAVVVQQLVPAETAGVMFTRNPFSGNPRQLSVVSAIVEPDTIVVKRSWDDMNLTVEETTVGSKLSGIVLGKESTVTDVKDQQRLCLNNEQLLALAHIGVTIEKLFGDPRDIEWAFVKDQIYLLQARPITALNAWTDFELQHEFDMVVPTDTEIMTLANVGEVFPGATKPLSLSITVRILDYSIQEQCQKRHKLRRSTENWHNICGPISFHVMLSGTNDTLTATREEKRSRQNLQKHLSLQAEQHTSSASLLAAIDSRLPQLLKASNSHGHMSRVSIFTQIAAMAVLSEGKEEWSTEYYTDFSLLLSSCSEVESAEIPTLLRDLAATIAEEDSEYFCSASPSEALNWIQTESAAASKFKSFLHAHGHRAIREFDFHTITWGMQPESLVKVIQVLVQNPHSSSDNEMSLSIAETCEILKCPTKEGTRRALRFILPYCRSAVARRERSKSSLISATHTFRLGYHRLAQLLVKEGKIPDTDILYYFSHYEISRLVHQSDAVLIAKAMRRRRLWSKWESLKFQEISFGVPMPLQEQEKPLLTEGTELKATPVCSGVVLGRACVITDLSQTSTIIQGDILITYSTDIGWSPYFPLLAGIVTELGGLISHGAVVAREYGLPCIVGASNATYIFKTGDLVRLNGGTGLLEKISKDPLDV
ncbi:hypothetical protein B566_EDAN011912 [Ephemera danica]|nr:hypothetical protein B566_EDAN011912 [Ephemera danica]